MYALEFVGMFRVKITDDFAQTANWLTFTQNDVRSLGVVTETVFVDVCESIPQLARTRGGTPRDGFRAVLASVRDDTHGPTWKPSGEAPPQVHNTRIDAENAEHSMLMWGLTRSVMQIRV